jgi:hypothetical protein
MEPETIVIPTNTALYLRAIRSLKVTITHRPPAEPVVKRETYAALYAAPSCSHKNYKFEVRTLTAYSDGDKADDLVGYFHTLKNAAKYCEDAAFIREAKWR